MLNSSARIIRRKKELWTRASSPRRTCLPRSFFVKSLLDLLLPIIDEIRNLFPFPFILFPYFSHEWPFTESLFVLSSWNKLEKGGKKIKGSVVQIFIIHCSSMCIYITRFKFNINACRCFSSSFSQVIKRKKIFKMV